MRSQLVIFTSFLAVKQDRSTNKCFDWKVSVLWSYKFNSRIVAMQWDSTPSGLKKFSRNSRISIKLLMKNKRTEDYSAEYFSRTDIYIYYRFESIYSSHYKSIIFRYWYTCEGILLWNSTTRTSKNSRNIYFHILTTLSETCIIFSLWRTKIVKETYLKQLIKYMNNLRRRKRINS